MSKWLEDRLAGAAREPGFSGWSTRKKACVFLSLLTFAVLASLPDGHDKNPKITELTAEQISPAILNECADLMQIDFPPSTRALRYYHFEDYPQDYPQDYVLLEMQVAAAELDSLLESSPLAGLSLSEESSALSVPLDARGWPSNAELELVLTAVDGGMVSSRFIKHPDGAKLAVTVVRPDEESDSVVVYWAWKKG